MTVFWLRLSGLIMLFGLALMLSATVIGQGMEKQVIAYLHGKAEKHPYGNIYYLEVNRGLAVRLSQVEVIDCCFAWSPDGTQLAFLNPDSEKGEYKVYLMNSDGSDLRRLTTFDNSSNETSPNWSPNGEYIIFNVFEHRVGLYQLYEMNGQGGDLRPLGSANTEYDFASYSPDGKQILFSKYSARGSDIYSMSLDGSNQLQLTSGDRSYFPVWSPDGTQIAYQMTHIVYDSNADIWIMNADGSAKRQLTTNAIHDSVPTWSPDGTQIAFSAGQNGHTYLYLINTDGSNQHQLTSNAINYLYPAWQP